VVELRWATGALEQVLRIREGINVDTSRAVR
jgi:hypothetical protein